MRHDYGDWIGELLSVVESRVWGQEPWDVTEQRMADLGHPITDGDERYIIDLPDDPEELAALEATVRMMYGA
jgi:hypothetical protein